MENCLKLRQRKILIYLILLCACMLFCACGKDASEAKPQENAAAAATPTLSAPTEPTESPVPTEPAEAAVTPTATPTATSVPTGTPMPTATPTPVITDPYDGRYWTGMYAEDKTVLMTKEEIQEQNDRNYRISGTKLVKLTEVTEYSAADIVAMIEAYSLPSRKYYDNREISSRDKENLLQARNLSALRTAGSKKTEPEYGILTENTDLRSFPTDKRMTSQVQGRFDYLQETRLLIGEAVLVLHRSADGTWCFVQAENYCGWIREKAVAYCTRDEFCSVAEAMADAENGAVVVVTKNGSYSAANRTIYLRMGTRLCGTVDGGVAYVQLPKRDAEGGLVWEHISLSCADETGTDCFAAGYLPYTRENVMRLAVRLLDAPYAWGDAPSFGADAAEVGDNGMDCSSTVLSIFRCFGFALPRNTGTQRKMDCVKTDLSGLGLQERREVLDGLQGGELLYTSGHVMLYLGQAGGEYYILHNTSTEDRDDGKKDEFYRCVITTTGLGKTGQTITERLIQMNALLPID